MTFSQKPHRLLSSTYSPKRNLHQYDNEVHPSDCDSSRTTTSSSIICSLVTSNPDKEDLTSTENGRYFKPGEWFSNSVLTTQCVEPNVNTYWFSVIETTAVLASRAFR